MLEITNSEVALGMLHDISSGISLEAPFVTMIDNFLSLLPNVIM